MENFFTEITQMLLYAGISTRIIKKSKKYLNLAASKEGFSLEQFNKLMDFYIYHIGRSTKVLHKADRNFRGYKILMCIIIISMVIISMLGFFLMNMILMMALR